MIVAAALAACLAAPASSGAAVKAYEASEEANYFGEFRRAKCKLRRRDSGRTFHAAATTTNRAYTLDIDIYEFRGFRRSYAVPYGAINPTVSFEGVFDEVDYSNNYPFPGGSPPPGGAGRIEFAPRGAKVGLGIYALPSQDYSEGAVLAGAMRCRYR